MNAKVTELLEVAVRWAESDPLLAGVALVGSYARGAARADSDVDLVIFSVEPERYVEDTRWLDLFGKVISCMQEDWGPVTSLRVFYVNGLEVKFSLTTFAWAAVPVDAGTRRVVSDGMQILYDPDSVFGMLQEAVSASS